MGELLAPIAAGSAAAFLGRQRLLWGLPQRAGRGGPDDGGDDQSGEGELSVSFAVLADRQRLRAG